MTTTSFRPLGRQRLSGTVADQIEAAILDGSLPVGERLASEQHLAGQFAVSRNVVREAFKVLQERGLIAIVNGSGAFVAHPNTAATSNALGRYLRMVDAKSSITALYETRRIMEGNNARLAAERATAQDLDTLAACLQRMRDHAGSIERWSEADLQFHLALAQATHNPLLRALLEPLVDQLRDVIAEGYLTPGAIETGLEAHTHLYACLCARDADGAYTIIMEHLRHSEEMITNAVGSRQSAVSSQPSAIGCRNSASAEAS